MRLGATLLTLLLLVLGVRALLTGDGPDRPAGASAALASRDAAAHPTPAGGGRTAPGVASSAAATSTPAVVTTRRKTSPGTTPLPSGLTAADVAAGVRTSTVAWDASGELDVVPGTRKAPGGAPSFRIRVEVERGLDVDAQRFADFVLDTLNDPRSWGHGGKLAFARVDGGRFDLRVVLASPDLSARMCRPLVTKGTLSCRNGNASILTSYRWIKAIPDYGSDRTGYRHYVVNHEVGHGLGHGHEYCGGRGERAPVMMQQTKGLKGCRANPWPYP